MSSLHIGAGRSCGGFTTAAGAETVRGTAGSAVTVACDAACCVRTIARGTVTDANESSTDPANAASAIAINTACKRSRELCEPANDGMIVRTVEQRNDTLRERQYSLRTREKLGSR